jgi:5-methylcytosine-specific restriction endonuclease McrA
MTAQGTYTPQQAAYRHYLRSPRWRLLRWLRRRIDGGRCTRCGAHGPGVRFEIHHLRYDNKGGSFWRELLDLRTLCSECHGKEHGKP